MTTTTSMPTTVTTTSMHGSITITTSSMYAGMHSGMHASMHAITTKNNELFYSHFEKISALI